MSRGERRRSVNKKKKQNMNRGWLRYVAVRRLCVVNSQMRVEALTSFELLQVLKMQHMERFDELRLRGVDTRHPFFLRPAIGRLRAERRILFVHEHLF